MVTANYGERVLAYLLDVGFVLVPGLVASSVGMVMLFQELSRPFGVLLLVAAVGWMLMAGFWNEVVRQGRLAQTVGKRRRGISLVRADSGLPIGVGLAFVRVLVVWIGNLLTGGLFIIVDLIVPAFDDQGRRLVDRLLSTRVVNTGVRGVMLPVLSRTPDQLSPPPGWG